MGYVSDRPPHNESLGDRCTCFGCHIGTLQFKGVMKQSKQRLRPVEQPPAHWGRQATLDRPGGKVPVFHPDGSPVRVREATTHLAHRMDEMQTRNTHLSTPKD